MSEIEHVPEFREGPKPAPKPSGEPGSLAVAYAMTFSTPAGQRVLADLQTKFAHTRPRFGVSPGQHRADHTLAAIIDGQCTVLREIEEAIKAGTPVAKISSPQP